jgi:hypothetical protein
MTPELKAHEDLAHIEARIMQHSPSLVDAVAAKTMRQEQWEAYALKRAEAQARARVRATYRHTHQRPEAPLRAFLVETTSIMAHIRHERSAAALAAAKQWRQEHVAKVQSSSAAVGRDEVLVVQKGVGCR